MGFVTKFTQEAREEAARLEEYLRTFGKLDDLSEIAKEEISKQMSVQDKRLREGDKTVLN